MKPMRYGTATDEDVRLSETGQRIKTEGLARDVDAHVPHSALVPAGGPERAVHVRVDERWGVRLRDPLEPDGYFALFDRMQRWYAAGSWLRPLEMLARQSLEARNVAVSQTDITTHTRAVREELHKVLGQIVPTEATLHQRQLIATVVANALIRLIPRTRSGRGTQAVALGPNLVRFLNEHGHLATVTLDAERRSALIRRVWRDLERARGDLLTFAEGVRNAAP
jgi:hypothetical protein